MQLASNNHDTKQKNDVTRISCEGTSDSTKEKIEKRSNTTTDAFHNRNDKYCACQSMLELC